MRRIPTPGFRTPRVFTFMALVALLLLTVVIVNFNSPFASVRRASAAAVIPVTTPPPFEAFITSPVNGTVYPPSTQITIAATAVPGNPFATVTRVDFYSSTTLIGTSTVAPYSITWKIPGTGFYVLTVKAYDTEGAFRVSFPVTIEVPFTNPPPPPQVSITSPVNNATYSVQAFFPISVSVTDKAPNATILKVEVYNGTFLIGTSTAPPFDFAYIAADPATYTLTARAYDNYGQVSISAPITVTTENLPAVVSINAVPASGSSFTAPANVLLTASVSNPVASIQEVDYYNGNMLLGVSTAAPYSFTWTDVPAGNYTVTAVAFYASSTALPGVTSAPLTISIVPGTCTVSYQLFSQWQGGFSAGVTITNSGSTINGWKLAFTFPGDQKITNFWNGTVSQSGNQVTVTNARWNGTIASQGTVSVGFNGSWTGNNTNPASFTLNGHACS